MLSVEVGFSSYRRRLGSLSETRESLVEKTTPAAAENVHHFCDRLFRLYCHPYDLSSNPAVDLLPVEACLDASCANKREHFNASNDDRDYRVGDGRDLFRDAGCY